MTMEKVEAFFQNRNPNFYTLLGTVFFSLGCAFVSGYNHEEAAKALDVWAQKIAYLLTNPVLGILVGIGLLIIGGFASHYRQKELDRQVGAERQAKDLLQEKLFRTSNTLTKQIAINATLTERISEHSSDAEYLKEENSRLHDKQVSTWLKGLCKYIGMDCASRVSIYFVNGESFEILARNSPNPLLGKFTPKTYKLEKGVISLSWQYGEYLDDKIPEDDDKYSEYMGEVYGFDGEHLAAINMKSRFMLGVAIVDADVKIGVILFEGLKKDSFNTDMIESIKKYCMDFQSYLCGFVKESIRYRQQATRVKRVGPQAEDHVESSVISRLKVGGDE
ncbi:hypothetical protein [Vibrio cincinnatiensis]